MTIPSPRLEFRWRHATPAEHEGRSILHTPYVCEYGLVLPVASTDPRRFDFDNEPLEIFHVFNATLSSHGDQRGEIPMRDGVHSRFDSAALGFIPVYVRNLDGSLTKHNFEAAPR